jgi:hypothetical protein
VWRVTSWLGNPRWRPLRRGSSCLVPPLHARDLDGPSSSCSVYQITIILYIIRLYSYILGVTHRPEMCTPAMPELGETRRMRHPGRSESRLGTCRDAWHACLPVCSSKRQASHASPVSHDRDDPARPACRRCPVGSRRLSVCVHVPPEDGPGGTGGATEPPDERVVSWRERTAEAVNPVEPWEVTPRPSSNSSNT